jgi:hypothetical protein
VGLGNRRGAWSTSVDMPCRFSPRLGHRTTEANRQRGRRPHSATHRPGDARFRDLSRESGNVRARWRRSRWSAGRQGRGA